jgi:hypothetical protein
MAYKCICTHNSCRPIIPLIIGLPYDHPHPSDSRQLAYKNFGCYAMAYKCICTHIVNIHMHQTAAEFVIFVLLWCIVHTLSVGCMVLNVSHVHQVLVGPYFVTGNSQRHNITC